MALLKSAESHFAEAQKAAYLSAVMLMRFSPARHRFLIVAALGVAALACFGQRARGPRGMDPSINTEDSGNGKDRWEVDADHPEDHLTFVRLRHSGHKNGYTDFPKAEINFTNRLQQLTALQVNPEYIQLDITDPKLYDYPFVYMTNVANISFDRSEAEALRKYLNNGGFLIVDDFWGDGMWNQWYDAMKDVFPEKEPMELDHKHEIFRNVFVLDKIPQVPSIDAFIDHGVDYEYDVLRLGETEESLDTPHFRAWYDDKGRMVVLAFHNNDIADGWEEEQTSPEFFKTFSEKYSFPLGINILVYAMTH